MALEVVDYRVRPLLIMSSYPARYSDRNGTLQTLIENDGHELAVVIRGVRFAGRDFDMLDPQPGEGTRELSSFTLSHGSLAAFILEWAMPIRVREGDRVSVAALECRIDLGLERRVGRLEHEILFLALEHSLGRFESSGKSGWFEDELLEIQAALPAGHKLEACITCLYSDYSPYGHGLFGNMLCFRNLKTEYLRVKSKDDFWAVHDRYEEMVQETYLCPEYETRIPGTGYRG